MCEKAFTQLVDMIPQGTEMFQGSPSRTTTKTHPDENHGTGNGNRNGSSSSSSSSSSGGSPDAATQAEVSNNNPSTNFSPNHASKLSSLRLIAIQGQSSHIVQPSLLRSDSPAGKIQQAVVDQQGKRKNEEKEDDEDEVGSEESIKRRKT